MVILSQKGDIQKDDTYLLSMTLVLLILYSELFLRVVTLCLTTHIHLSLSTVCIPQTYPEYTLQIFQDVYKNALGHCWKNCHKIGTTRFSYFTLKKPILFFFFHLLCSVSQSCLTLCDPMDCMQHTRLPSPLSLGVYSNSCTLSQWCHPTISSSVSPFSSCPPSFPASGSFPMSWLFASGGQNIGASTSSSVLPMNNQGWFPLGLTDFFFNLEIIQS